ncbi:MAG: acyl-CoA thioesterase [Aquabacterium sp.]
MQPLVDKTTHPLDQALQLTPLGDDRVQGQTHPGWANMVGPYGGITAAVLLQAVMTDPRRLGEPVALTVNYPAALADGPYEVHRQPARTTRSTQHWVLRIEQDGQVVNTATLMTALRRPGWGHTEATMPAVAAADTIAPSRRMRPIAWIGNYDMRFVAGPFPDLAQARDEPDSVSLLWLRDEPPRPLDFPALAALCDVFYPRIFRRRGQPTPAGTVSFTVYFHADTSALAAVGPRHVLARAVGQHYGLGFSDQAGLVWSPDGALLASTHQMMYFKG